MKSIAQKYVRLGHHPEDLAAEKLKKSSLLVVSGPFVIAGIVWGILYFSHGLILPGAIPFCYGILSLLSIVGFGITKQYKFFRNSQLILILILPFALQISLGGFVPSSAVMYWAIIAPAGAMFFDSIKKSVYWFAAYLILVVIAYLINDLIPSYVNWDLSDDFINVLFLMNIVGVSCIVFGILYYFVNTITNLNKEVRKKSQVLEEQSTELKKMDKIKSRFFANISHEFRTPLTLILGLAKNQLNDVKKPPDPRDSQTIIRNANQLLQLINQLLDLSKLESGELKIQVSKNDILFFVKNKVAQFESLTNDKNIKLSFNGHPIKAISSEEPIEFYFDREKMQTVLNNLLSNAVKFTPDGEQIAVEVELKRSVENDLSLAMIRVINTGITIPDDKQLHLFDRFYQVDSSSNRQFEGTGIGLALVKELVELHHGKVGVSSKMNKTCFTIEIPVNHVYLDRDIMIDPFDSAIIDPGITAQKPWNQLPNNDELGIPAVTSQYEILVVEDNSDLRSYINKILSPEYNVQEAVDGIQGFEVAEATIPDLIISDVMMPKMNGYELCKKLKSDEKTNHIPVIMLTAKAARENKLEGLQKGADDYLVKPFDEQELKLRVGNLLTLRERLQKRFQLEINLKPKEIKVSSVHQQFLEKLKEAVEKHIDNELFSVDDLGKELGMSRSQIHRKLKALTNQSATSFIRKYRLHRAADLIKQDVGNITEIAYMVGFNSQTYFSSSFQDLFGASPSEFKKQIGTIDS